jgi:hypothetical protein
MGLDIWLYVEVDTGGKELKEIELYDANITHNLGPMADLAGVYLPLWRPGKAGVEVAADLIEPIRNGIEDMKARPDFFRQFDAENGWGKYRDFLPWLEELLAAREEHPKAKVGICR